MARSIKRGKATPSRYRELSSDGFTLEGNKLLRHRLPLCVNPWPVEHNCIIANSGNPVRKSVVICQPHSSNGLQPLLWANASAEILRESSEASCYSEFVYYTNVVFCSDLCISAKPRQIWPLWRSTWQTVQWTEILGSHEGPNSPWPHNRKRHGWWAWVAALEIDSKSILAAVDIHGSQS